MAVVEEAGLVDRHVEDAAARRHLGRLHVRRSGIVRAVAAHAFGVDEARRRLQASGGGYEIVHESPGLEVGVYVLVAPEADRQQPHADDEVYVVLEGGGLLEVEGMPLQLTEGKAAFVPAGADHRFSAYERLAVLVIFARH